jgi:hypothetical protein
MQEFETQTPTSEPNPQYSYKYITFYIISIVRVYSLGKYLTYLEGTQFKCQLTFTQFSSPLIHEFLAGTWK